ncbi:hypothetical protein GCM10019016_103940 [Streptomyces prasinosporus]|uniref:Uncharacterized protein n=1 Tax=Streptomyces prasinosporus TaxID=68256 RepID=A0ABP6U9Q4_9ACTN
MERIAGRFGRVEPRATARASLLGLLPRVERKNYHAALETHGTGYVPAVATALASDAAPQQPAIPEKPARVSRLITPTVLESRRLLAAFPNPPTVSATGLLSWSIWRRRHQATARRSHYRRRTASEPTGWIAEPDRSSSRRVGGASPGG